MSAPYAIRIYTVILVYIHFLSRQRDEVNKVNKVYTEAKARLENEELGEKATGSVNGSGNRRIVVVGQMSGRPRAIARDRK